VSASDGWLLSRATRLNVSNDGIASETVGANGVSSNQRGHDPVVAAYGVRQTKVALRCDSEDELLLLQAQAQSLNICARSIQDA
jgi:peptidyl-tRNA hydrolase